MAKTENKRIYTKQVVKIMIMNLAKKKFCIFDTDCVVQCLHRNRTVARKFSI